MSRFEEAKEAQEEPMALWLGHWNPATGMVNIAVDNATVVETCGIYSMLDGCL